MIATLALMNAYRVLTMYLHVLCCIKHSNIIENLPNQGFKVGKQEDTQMRLWQGTCVMCEGTGRKSTWHGRKFSYWKKDRREIIKEEGFI